MAAAPMQVLEHRLSLKLMLLENAVARLSSMKSELRLNAEQVRKDIVLAIQHQVSCLRTREQDLLTKLERIVSAKEVGFDEQQDVCNSTMDNLEKSGEDNAKITSETLLRLNALSMKPQGNPNVAFEFDPTDCRIAISNFGHIFSEPHNQVESLPMDMEVYDDAFLAHKSILQLPKRASDELRSMSAFSEDSNCSFEIVRSEEATPFFGAHINQVARSENQAWLQTAENAATPRASPAASYQAPSADAFKPANSGGEAYKFGAVINGIASAENRQWLLQECAASTSDALTSAFGSRLSLSTPAIASAAEPALLDSIWLQKPSRSSCAAFRRPLASAHALRHPPPDLSRWLANKSSV